MNDMPKIVPSLWFDESTEEAIDFYVAVFNGSPHKRRDSRILSVNRYEKGMEAPRAEHMENPICREILLWRHSGGRPPRAAATIQ